VKSNLIQRERMLKSEHENWGVRPVVGPGAANICADIEPGPTEHKKPTVLRRSNNLGLANDILE
jgi:hypothetical protein